MSRPQITKKIGGYLFDWQEEKIAINVNHIRTNSDGEIKGEISVTTTLPGYAPHLHQARYNFSSSRSRSELNKQLSSVCKEVEWQGILEQLSVYTTENVRAGEPVLELWPNADATPPEYLLYPFIVKNYPSILFGDPGSFKSNLSILFMAIMSIPWKENPVNLIAPNRMVKGIYFDWETDSATINWQMTCFQNGMDIPIFPISYRRCALPLADDVEQIAKAIYDSNAEVSIIDSVALACGGELNEAGTVLRFFSALRSLNTTSLLLAHTSKDQQTKKKTIYGSIFFEAQARSVWEIRKVQEAGDNEIDLGLFNRKPPPFQKIHKPLGYKVRFEDTQTIVSPQEPKTVAEFIERMGTQDRIVALLRGGAMSAQEIMEQLEISRANVDQALKRIRDKGLIIPVGDKKWGLVAQSEYA